MDFLFDATQNTTYRTTSDVLSHASLSESRRNRERLLGVARHDSRLNSSSADRSGRAV
jgi:hypothetical protein